MSTAFTNAEVGALLIAVGAAMMNADLIFGAALDGASNALLKIEIHDQLVNGENYDSDTANEVADRLLAVPYKDLMRILNGEVI